MDQHYRSENIVVNNQPHSEYNGPRSLPVWVIVSIVLMIACQIFQFIMIIFLYHYIGKVETRMENSVKESRTYIHQLIKKE